MKNLFTKIQDFCSKCQSTLFHKCLLEVSKRIQNQSFSKLYKRSLRRLKLIIIFDDPLLQFINLIPYLKMDNSLSQVKIKAYKIVFVGPQAAGKSSILNRIVSSKFQQNYHTTIGVDFKTIKVSAGEKQIPIQLWDTAGQQKFKSLTRSYFKGSHAAICVFDLQDKNSLKRCEYYLEQALNESISPECIYLVGNKKDEGAEYSENGRQIAQNYEVKYIEASAKTGQGVNEIINTLAQLLIQKVGEIVEKSTQLRPNIEIKQGENKKCAC